MAKKVWIFDRGGGLARRPTAHILRFGRRKPFVSALFTCPRDNGFVAVPIGFVHQAQLKDAVIEAVEMLDAREVRDVRFTIGSDADGEPSVFFGILLTAYATHASRFADVTGRVATTLFDELQPFNRWGLQPYFNFTSDLAHFKNPGWM